MNFTNDYIEKVSKAKEIQGLCKYKKGDWFLNVKNNTTYILYFDKGRFKDSYVKKIVGKDTWLPTLDDLFGMLLTLPSLQGRVMRPMSELTVQLSEYKIEYWQKYNKNIDTLEDLKEYYLVYLMKEKYNKQWNPDTKEWEAIE